MQASHDSLASNPNKVYQDLLVATDGSDRVYSSDDGFTTKGCYSLRLVHALMNK